MCFIYKSGVRLCISLLFFSLNFLISIQVLNIYSCCSISSSSWPWSALVKHTSSAFYLLSSPVIDIFVASNSRTTPNTTIIIDRWQRKIILTHIPLLLLACSVGYPWAWVSSHGVHTNIISLSATRLLSGMQYSHQPLGEKKAVVFSLPGTFHTLKVLYLSSLTCGSTLYFKQKKKKKVERKAYFRKHKVNSGNVAILSGAEDKIC